MAAASRPRLHPLRYPLPPPPSPLIAACQGLQSAMLATAVHTLGVQRLGTSNTRAPEAKAPRLRRRWPCRPHRRPPPTDSACALQPAPRPNRNALKKKKKKERGARGAPSRSRPARDDRVCCRASRSRQRRTRCSELPQGSSARAALTSASVRRQSSDRGQ